jgi:N-acetylneuraminate lyase
LDESRRLRGLIAATYTPFTADLAVDPAAIAAIVERLVASGVSGLYVCGSTGEGVSLSTPERKQVLEAYIAAVDGRLPVVAQVGHNSLVEACDLAAHAHQAGATAVSALAPAYFKPGSVEMLVECCRPIAEAAAELPFYYYHIPVLTGVALPMVPFLREAGAAIPNFAGLKYTAATLNEYQECVAVDGGRFDVLYGFDELLLPALSVGARGAVGSTYNIAAPLYLRLIDAFDAGNLESARELQLQAIRLINTLARFPFHPAVKVLLGWLGTPCGECRPPQPRLTAAQQQELRQGLEVIGFFHDHEATAAGPPEPRCRQASDSKPGRSPGGRQPSLS